MTKILVVSSVCLFLAGCGLPVAGIITAGTSMYCAGVSEDGKQFIRNAMGLPIRVISCHEALATEK